MIKFLAAGLLALAGAVQAQMVEAETGSLHGTRVDKAHAGFSGSGYVTDFLDKDDAVEIGVECPRSGFYDLKFRYSAEGPKDNDLFINGAMQMAVHFPKSDDFREVGPFLVQMKAGMNTVKILKSWGHIELDALTLEPGVLPLLKVAPTLSNPKAGAKAKALMCYLTSQYGKRVITGQTGLGDANWILEQTGKKPAMVGFDMMDYSPSRVAKGATCAEVDQALVWARTGGMVQFQWHWNAPDHLTDKPGKEWWRGFYTEATSFDLAKALKNPKSMEYQHLLRDIDAIAVQLKVLKDAGVPVLWRPLHEAQGGWFWWGAKGPGSCKALYRLVYDRLVNFHQMDNLIWVWVSGTAPTALDWYPGDDVVDVIGADIYAPPGSHGPLTTAFYSLVRQYKGAKLIALTENGPLPDPEHLKAQGAAWAWFMTWSGDFIREGKQNSKAVIKTTYRSPHVVTADKLPAPLACP